MKKTICILALLLINLIMMQGFFMPPAACAQGSLTFTASPKSNGAGLVFTPNGKPSAPAASTTPSSASAAQVASLTATINTDNILLMSLRNQVTTASATAASLTASLASANSSLSAANASLSTTTASLATANTNLGIANTNLAAKTALAASLQTQVNNLNSQVSSLNTQVSGLTTQITGLNASVASLTSQNSTLTSSNNTLVSQNGTLTTSNNSLTAANNTLSSQNSTLTAANSTLTASNVSLTASVSSLNSQVTTLNASVSSLTGQVSTLNASVSSLTSQVSTLTAANVTLTANLATETALAASNIFNGRVVGLHSIPAGSPYYIPAFGGTNPYANPYGSLYPLALQPPTVSETSAQIAARYAAMKTAGVDLIEVDSVNQPFATNSQIYEALDYAAGAGLVCAPCFDFSSDGGKSSTSRKNTFISKMTNYAARVAGGGQPSLSAARTSTGALIALTYDQYDLAESDWVAAKSALAAQSPPINIFLWAGEPYPPIPADIGGYDAVYEFGYATDDRYSTALAAFVSPPSGPPVPFGLAIQPGLDRPGMGYIDPYCTASMRSDSDRLVSTAALYPGQNTLLQLTTWDDNVEKANIQPSSWWGNTRVYVSAWEAARFHGTPPPFTDLRVSVTSPQAVYRGTTSTAEGLVFNGTGKAAHMNVTLLNPYGSGFSQSSSTIRVPCPPGQMTAAQVTVDPTAFGSNGIDSHGLYWCTARVVVTDDATGGTIKTIYSAPIHLVPGFLPSGVYQRTRYLSKCSDGDLGTIGGAQYLHRTGSAGSYSYTANITPGSVTGTIRFCEIIHDGTRQWQQFYNSVPSGSDHSYTPTVLDPDDDSDPTDYGMYYIRIISQDSAGNYYTGYTPPQVFN